MALRPRHAHPRTRRPGRRPTVPAPAKVSRTGPVLWKAKRGAIGAESSEKILFVGHDLSLLRLSDELDDVTLLRDTLSKHERIKPTARRLTVIIARTSVTFMVAPIDVLPF
jgi:hypothetical protein